MSTEIAKTILQQLGGNKFIVMTGAKNLTAYERKLCFTLPARFAKGGINHVTIELDSSDTYIMAFQRRQRSPKTHELLVKDIAHHDYIYWDQLQNIFTRETGLDTHL